MLVGSVALVQLTIESMVEFVPATALVSSNGKKSVELDTQAAWP